MKELLPDLHPEQQTTVREQLQQALNEVNFIENPIEGLDILDRLEQAELQEKQEKRRIDVMEKLKQNAN